MELEHTLGASSGDMQGILFSTYDTGISEKAAKKVCPKVLLRCRKRCKKPSIVFVWSLLDLWEVLLIYGSSNVVWQ